jgi:hypothetical protein
MNHYKIEKLKGPDLVVDADGMYMTPNGDLSLFQTSCPAGEPMSIEESMMPTVNVVVASFAAGAWYSAYQIEKQEAFH